MNIAQIVPNWSQFHADSAIGIKAVARDLCLGLKKTGHHVVLFAPNGSTFEGTTVVFSGQSLKDQGIKLNDPRALAIQHEYAKALLPKLVGFDLVHSHAEHALLPFVHELSAPVVSTVHGAGFDERVQSLFRRWRDGIFVALSHAAVRALPFVNFSHVVYNGITLADTTFHPKPQPPAYLAWMGRFSPDKGALDAIKASKQSGNIIVLVGFDEPGQEAYVEKVRTHEDGATVRLLDRMIGKMKYSFLGNAKALLFPIHWEEPFGLVMVEAMACGTPVVAYNRGSVPEIVRDGVTGFIVDEERGVGGLVEAIKRIGEIDRTACRRHVEDHFTVEKMVDNYEAVYKKVLGL